jgi:hypothetical protein
MHSSTGMPPVYSDHPTANRPVDAPRAGTSTARQIHDPAPTAIGAP